MKILSENRLTFSIVNKQKNEENSYSSMPSRTMNPPTMFAARGTVVPFLQSSTKLAEKKDNLIIDDVFKIKRFIPADSVNPKKPVDRLVEGLKFQTEKIIGDKGQKLEKITIKDKENVLMEATRAPQHKNIKIGFCLGKCGTYGILQKTDEHYMAVVPKGSSITTGDGLSIKVVDHSQVKQPSFKGRNNCTVNIMFRPEKTKKSVMKFQELFKSKGYLKGVEPKKGSFEKNYYPYILAGGFGTRLGIISMGRQDNKPSSPTPAKDWDLINFTLLNLHRVNLLSDKTDINYHTQSTNVGPAGCFVEALGYKVVRGKNGFDLKKMNESEIPKDKNTIILAADAITDMDYSKFLEKFDKTPDAGFMMVGIPVSEDLGGIIAHDSRGRVSDFIEAPRPNTADADPGLIKETDKDGNVQLKLNEHKQRQYLGNAFIHIIKPELHDVIKDIYQEKINTSYNEVLKSKNGNKKLITKAEEVKIMELVWGRDVIPKLLEKSAKNELLDKNNKQLHVYTHVADDCDWCDVGKFSKYVSTMQEIASGSKYRNLPPVLKEEIKKNIDGQVIYTTDAKKDFQALLGEGKTEGPILILRKED